MFNAKKMVNNKVSLWTSFVSTSSVFILSLLLQRIDKRINSERI